MPALVEALYGLAIYACAGGFIWLAVRLGMDFHRGVRFDWRLALWTTGATIGLGTVGSIGALIWGNVGLTDIGQYEQPDPWLPPQMRTVSLLVLGLALWMVYAILTLRFTVYGLSVGSNWRDYTGTEIGELVR